LLRARTSVLERYRLGSGAVVGAQVVPGAEHSLRHPDSHIANTDEGDGRHFNVSVIRLSAKLAVL